MAREFSKHQQSLIRNYYQNRDAIDVQRLQEIVTDIYLAGSGKKATKLWERAEAILLRAPNADKDQIAKMVADRDLETLAAMAGERFGG